MHAHALSPLRALFALLALFFVGLAPSIAEAQRPRVIVLSFEGWHAEQARRAALSGLETSYELVDEAAAVTAAGEIGVDVSTPDGMSAVVAHLGIELVVGGSVTGRNRAASTTIWVSDIHGTELATGTGPSPSARGAAAAIGEAARQAVETAYLTLHPPAPPPVEVDDAPPMFEEEEDERPGEARPVVDDSGRWRLPFLRLLVGLDLRNRTASIAPNVNVSRFDADVFPTIAFQIESHPLSFSSGPENGLFLSVSGAFSAGITYSNGIDFQNYPMNTYFFEGNAGYGGIIADMVEIGGTLGFGVDGVGLQQRDGMPVLGRRGDQEYPSVELLYFRPAIYARVRLFQDLVQLEGGFGGRIFAATGQIGSNQGVWDDGAGSGGGFDFNLGIGGIIDPGFTYAARFGFTGNYIGLSDGARRSTGATEEAIHIQLFVGWAFLP